DLQNPFRNPTEEPDYNPDYREILPTLDMPDCKLPLIPQQNERAALKRCFALTFLILLFAFVTAATIFILLQTGVTFALQKVDLKKLGELPENYPMIVKQFLNDSAINSALTLIAFTVGNLSAFLIGCRLTHLRRDDLFRLRGLNSVRTMSYVLLGLWIQLLAGYASGWLTGFLEKSGVPVYSPDISLSGSAAKTAAVVLYTCVLAPITEELLVRGFALKNLSRVSQRFGILLTALLFGLMHENLPQLVFTVPLGILLAYITIRHNSLTPAIITHIAVNSAAIMREYGRTMLPHSTFRKARMLYTLVVLLLGTVSLFYMLLTERMPDLTPHQSARSKRLVMTAPLFWVLVAVHLGMTFAAAYLM
ncbi:MAG: CPBP family intramembrane metalloprotease, partial [Oscillospiraceae bacterium]|nr:CPBP family intramembrane metalloprotease [Oscillospiraceae bacterium]